jgi:S1-C subfamily serine protease/Tfp pilus assembly protein PilF
MIRSRALAVLFLILLTSGGRSQSDIRDQYGTKDLEAAQHIQRGIQLGQTRKHKEAIAAFDAALKLDKQCQMAYFQRALSQADLGNIEEAIEGYKTALSDTVRRSRNISAVAAVNLAITYAKLKEFDDAHLWFTRAILEDSENQFKQRGKAYRNLAIALSAQGKHLGAALAIALAYQDRAPNCDMRMVMQFFEKAEGEEVARLMHFGDKPTAPAKRDNPSRLDAVAIDKTITEPVTDLLTDPQGRYILALVKDAPHYYVITTEDKPAIRKVTVSKPILASCLVQGSLYAAAREPNRIEQIEPLTGKVMTTYSLRSAPPSSLAVFPVQERAYFPVDQEVQELNLKSGAVSKSSIPGQVVIGHPNQRFLYSYIKPDRRSGGGGRVIIDGRAIYFPNTNWQQSTLFKSVVAPKGLMLADVRDNAASNAFRMSLSPDGNWVALAGGGGWRSTIKGQETGYGVAVFSAHNFEHLQGFFKTDAYPQGVCFNPVTGQTAAIRGDDAKVYHLSDSKTPVELKGKFSGAGAWSGNGRYLVLGLNGGGIGLYENNLTAAELKLAVAWWKDIKAVAVAPAQAATATFQAVAEYEKFAIAEPTRDDLTRALAKALTGRTDRPGNWEEYGNYNRAEPARQAVEGARPMIASKMDLGIAIFQLKKALKAHPDAVPVHFFLAEAQRLNDQGEAAEENYVGVVKADAGRTDLSCLSLNALAGMLAAKDRGTAALHCLAASLYLDRANPKTLAQAIPLLKKNKFDTEADRFAKLASSVAAVVPGELPALPKPGKAEKLDSADLYRKAVWSVVLIKTGKGSGSGVCVGAKDIILTNHHVIDGGGEIEVYPFIVKDKSPVRLPMVRASVVFQSEKHDVAVLKLEKAPDTLEPLLVAAMSPSPGERVYAIGSPGLGREILEQSISQGLVSSKSRNIEGVPYLQHSAAVNPGNSGGPLLDEFGHVVGVVTLKARLENVSFAIPVETLRSIFKSSEK